MTIYNDCVSERKKITINVILELIVVLGLVYSYALNIPYLTLISFVFACILIVFSKYNDSIYFLAFFTSFAGIFVYNQKHMFFVMVALFILRSFIENRIRKSTIVFYVIIIAYSFLFCDFQGDFTFAKVIGLILLFAVPIIAYASSKFDCKILLQHYIFGFFIETVIGFFVKYIPSMYNLFDTDLMWTKNYLELTRFFGLAYDSNFYALSNFIVIAYLLFAFEKISIPRCILILFFIISGVQTISKSYLIVVSILIILYVIKNIFSWKHLIVFTLTIIISISIFSVVSDKMGYNAIELTLSRFVPGGSFSDNTTGRTEIWKDYIELFNTSGIKNLLFGFGFNAKVTSHAAHNTFIEFVFHYGIIGLLLWMIYFIHCGKIFRINTKNFENKSFIVLLSLIVGIFFLSAYTYESFWFGIVISLMTFDVKNKKRLS